jgi:hypothetical protein
VLIKDGQVNLLFPQAVLASEVASLLNLKLFNASISGILNHGLEDIDPACGEPLVTPFPKVEVSAKRPLAMLKVSVIESTNKVLELCVGPHVSIKVDCEPFHYDIAAK